MALIKDYPNTDWATATELTVVPRINYPFREWGDSSGYIVERDYCQARASYTGPQALDTADGTYTDAYLIEETAPAEADTSLITFTRRYATVPSSFTAYGFEGYSFPGYYADVTEGLTNFRPEQVRLTAVSRYYTFIKSASGTFSVVGNKFEIEKTLGDATLVKYVNPNTNPTLTTYEGYVSGNTEIRLTNPEISRAYGVGNIWLQIDTKAVAQ